MLGVLGTAALMSKMKSHSVLRLSRVAVSQAAVRRHYAKFRLDRQLPARCDNPTCRFHTEPLIWNGEKLPVILDHVNGVRADNRPQNLRYLCPNCDSLLETRGGRNRGRVRHFSDNAYVVASRDGRLAHTSVIDSGQVGLGGHVASVVIGKSSVDA